MRKKIRWKSWSRPVLALLAALALSVSGCSAETKSAVSGAVSDALSEALAEGGYTGNESSTVSNNTADKTVPASDIVYTGGESPSLSALPSYTGEAYAVINDNVPQLPKEDFNETSFETYSDLDALGRCGTAYANIGRDLMPKEERGSIGNVKPSGWQTAKYDIVDGKYLYNRCHLIGYQLTAENANEKNLITGTRYMNVDGMLPFENLVADYIKETDNHVLYRVTPFFEGDNLVASGVLMEAESVEDGGEGVEFNVFVFNVQPGILINYADGSSELAADAGAGTSADEKTSDAPQNGAFPTDNAERAEEQEESYVLNTSSRKFHRPECPSVNDIRSENREDFTGSRQELINSGYAPCGRCKP